MQTVINDVITNYEVLGKNSKETLLIIHGWRRNLGDWLETARQLESKYKVVLIDLPGHGGSSLPKTPFNTTDYADFVIKFLSKLNIKNPILMGHSFGGKTGIVVASKIPIKKLILVDASGIEEKSLIVEIKITLAKLLKTLHLPTRIREQMASRDYKEAGELLPSFKKIVKENVENEAKKVDAQTLIIWGDKDTEISSSAAKKFKSLIKNSIIRIVWGSNHHPHLEKPEKFISLLEEYI